MWALWEKAVPVDKRHSLCFFVTVTIENEMTLSLIKSALDNIGEDLTQQWHVFNMGTNEGKVLLSTYARKIKCVGLLTVLLGSPNGAGFAHFSIERKG
jgi:hypothetical protein